MHILFLSDNFPPEVNAPASRTYEHCREWVDAGHRVTVVTCAPNFPKGRVFEGYRNRLWQTEIIDGIRVIRVWTYITANEGFTKRVLDYLSFMIAAVVASPFVRHVDVVIGTSPQFFTACAAYLVAAVKRVPWVFELRDLWPESIRAVGAMKESRALDLLEKVELFLYEKATLIVTVTNAFKGALVRRGIAAEKIHVVTNGVDVNRFTPRIKDPTLVARYGLDGKFVAGYIGTHGLAHSLDTVLDAAKKMMLLPQHEHFRFLLLGDGAKKVDLLERARREQIRNVIFVESVSKDEVVGYWALLDVAIIHLKKTDLFTSVIPSKLFECMGMAIPVLHGVEGESADIVEHESVGIAFEPENPEQLSAALCRMFEDKALYGFFTNNGPKAALNYDRRRLALRMLAAVEDVVHRSNATSR